MSTPGMIFADNAMARSPRRVGYQAPKDTYQTELSNLLKAIGRGALEDRQFDLLRSSSESRAVKIHYAGNLELLNLPCVSIVGTRDVSREGAARARRLVRELVEAGVVVASGLAKGVDTVAHTSAIEFGGRTVAVIGTPLDRAYPAENAELQTRIYKEHLLISPFSSGERTFKANFPKRNRVMAAVSDATVIVEASDTSGTLHQAAECGKLGRWLFIMQSVVEDPRLEWPKKFLKQPKAVVLSNTEELLSAISP